METTEATPVEEWVARNPLRRWRSDSGTSILGAAQKIGCAMTSIRLWEQGIHTPTEDRLAAVARVLGVTPEALGDEWATWMSTKPEG